MVSREGDPNEWITCPVTQFVTNVGRRKMIVTIKTKTATPKSKQPKKTAARKVKEATGLGCLVFYEFSGCKITPDDLTTIMKSEGGGAAPLIVPTQSVKDCGRAFRLGRAKGEDRFMGEVVHDDDDMCVIGVLQKKRPGERRVAYDQVDSLTWDKRANVWLSKGTNQDASVESAINVLISKIEHSQKYYGHEFLRPWLIQTELGLAGALKLKNTGGGPYYVTSHGMDKLNRLERICDQIDGCTLSILDVSSTPRAKKAVEHGVRNSLGNSLSELQEKIEHWKTSANRPRVDAVGSVLVSFKELRDQASLYGSILKIKMESMANEITECEGVLQELLFTQSESNASPGLVRKFSSAIDAARAGLIKEIGFDPDDYELSLSDLEAAGVPSSGRLHQSYYSRKNGGGAALAELGYRGKLDKKLGKVIIVALPKVSSAAA